MCRVDLGYIDKNGRLIIDRLEEVSPNYTPFDYYSAGNFSEGLARVCRNQKYGYVDLSGKEIIPCIYDNEDNVPAFGKLILQKSVREGSRLIFWIVKFKIIKK